jgi:hypothetical protein
MRRLSHNLHRFSSAHEMERLSTVEQVRRLACLTVNPDFSLNNYRRNTLKSKPRRYLPWRVGPVRLFFAIDAIETNSSHRVTTGVACSPCPPKTRRQRERTWTQMTTVSSPIPWYGAGAEERLLWCADSARGGEFSDQRSGFPAHLHPCIRSG